MRGYDLFYVGVLAMAALEVVIEMAISRRNERRLRSEGYREVAPWVFRAMVPVYVAAFVAGPLERFSRSPRPEPWLLGFVLLGALVAAKVLKSWVIVTLAGTWTKKVFVREGMTLRTAGPFAWVRHPNYVAMALEVPALSFIGATPATGAFVCLAFGLLLFARIKTEEHGLSSVAPYRETMARRASSPLTKSTG